jgi:hypothetical protein
VLRNRYDTDKQNINVREGGISKDRPQYFAAEGFLIESGQLKIFLELIMQKFLRQEQVLRHCSYNKCRGTETAFK